MQFSNEIPHEFRLVRPKKSTDETADNERISTNERLEQPSHSGPPSLSGSSVSSLSTMTRSYSSLSLPDQSRLSKPTKCPSSESCLSDSYLAGRRRRRRRGNDNEKPGPNLNLCIAQRSGASSVREAISRIERQMTLFSSPEDMADIDEQICCLYEDCISLAKLSSDPYYRVVVAANGGILALIDVMRSFQDHEDMQVVCCTAISKLSRNNPRAFERAGGLEVVLSAMQMHPLSSLIQTSCCDALRNFVSDNISHLELLKKQGNVSCLIQSAFEKGLLDESQESAEFLLQRLNATLDS